MKKFLSLVLALVMAMSLVTISAGAKDYTDASEITYKEAVDVMSELKIIDGYDDGSFNPDGTLTRGAAAKIICNLILGPTTAAALKADTAPFSDVPANHTFAGYIAYCAQQGIISGYNDGTFRPSNGLTGYAFMKMLLGALGYDQVTEGYVGANWSVNVAKQALAIGLDDGNDDFNGVAIVTREEALLYAFNTMTADMVYYSNKTEITTGDAVVTISGNRYVEHNDEFDYRDQAGDLYDDEDLQFCEKYFEDLTLDGSDTDVFGRWVNTWKNGKKTIGSYVKTPDAIYHADVKEKTIYADLGLDEVADFNLIVDGKDGNAHFEVEKKNNGPYDSVADCTSLLVGDGSDIYVYLDEDYQDIDTVAGDGDIVVINTYLVQAADDYDDKDEVLDVETIDDDGDIAGINYPGNWNGETLSSDDWDGLDEYADEDYILVTIAYDEDEDEYLIQSIEKAEPVSATVTEYVHGESVTAGGDEYAYSAASAHNDDNGTTYAYSLKETYDLYLDEEGNVLYADGEDADDPYVYVIEFSKHSTSTKSAPQAYVYFLDGTEDEITLNKVDGKKVTNSSVSGHTNYITSNDADHYIGWFTYTMTGDKYNLKPVAAQNGHETLTSAGTVVDYSAQHTEINAESITKDGTKATNFIIIDEDGDVNVYTGIKNVPDVEGATDTIVNINYDGSYAKNVYIDVNSGDVKNAGSTSDVIFLLENEAQGNDADDDGYYRYNALVNGVEKKIRYDEEIAGSDDAALTLWTDIEYTTKTYIEGATMVDGTVAADREEFSYVYDVADDDGGDVVTVTQKGNTLEIGDYATDSADDSVTGKNDYFMADEYTIYVIETDGDYDTYTMKQLARAGVPTDCDIWGVMNDDGEYTALYIVNNGANPQE